MNTKTVIILFLFISLFPFLSFKERAKIELSNLRCEMLLEPKGIDITKPRLSWEISGPENGIEQTAYQVIISSTKENLRENKADVWNSGKVISDQSIHNRYKGPALK